MQYSEFLIAHIGGGLVAILSGFAALFFCKGSRLHRAAGNVFFVSMLITATGAAVLGYLISEIDNTIAGREYS